MRIFLSFAFLLTFSVISISQDDWSRFEPIKQANATTTEALANTITAPFTEDLDKVRAIYYWLTHNITYDIKALEKLQKNGFKSKLMRTDEIAKKKQDAILRTLKEKKGVCQDYSNLFVKLCEHIAVDAVFIGGYSQANPFESGLGGNHAWNAFKHNGEWHLLDATFGAGRVMNGKKFDFDFNPGLFMTDPKVFVINHLPKESEWQLLKTSIDKKTFKEYAWLGAAFFKLGITSLKPSTKKLTYKRGENITIGFSCVTPIQKLDMYNMQSKKRLETVFVQDGETCKITIPAKNVRSGLYMIQTEHGSLISYRIVK